MGLYVGKTRKYKKAIIICIVISLIAIGGFVGSMFTGSILVLATVTGLMGFFMTPIFPLGLEFACEITFPIGEAVSGGVINIMAQFIGVVQVKLFLLNSL